MNMPMYEQKRARSLKSGIMPIMGIFPTPDPTKVLGLDVSKWSGTVDYQKAKDNGIQFVIIKGMDGTLRAGLFEQHYTGAKAAGLVVGSYTWLYRNVNISCVTQAKAFAAMMKQYPMDITPIVDFEWTSWLGTPSNPTTADLSTFDVTFAAEYGKHPMIYTAPGYWKQYGSLMGSWADNELWEANYDVATPTPILPWYKSYKFWQWTDHGDGRKYGQPAGSESADLNYYYGTQLQFNEEFKLGDTTPPPPDGEFLELISVKSEGLKIPSLIDVELRTQYGDMVVTIDQRPAAPPPPVVDPTLHRVASEYWPLTHAPLLVPPAGGPLTQTVSTAPKPAYFETPLDSGWVNYIAQWNTPKTLDKITARDFGPSKGYNDKGKLRYIGLVWPSNKSNPNVVKVLESSGNMYKIASIPFSAGVPDLFKYSPTSHPWLFHKVCDNRGNPVLVDGQPIVCPIIGDSLWVTKDAIY